MVFGQAKALVVADFWSADTIGCAPLVVQFHDSSSSNVVYRQWIFGNGNTSVGNVVSPSVIYSIAGYYTVTLIVSDGVDTASVTKTNYIHSLAKPTSSFFNQSTLIGCAPFPFQVYDNSTTTSTAPINSWVWDFDDGTPLVYSQNTIHTYASAGTYNVSLIVTDTMGCSNTSVVTNLVTVQPKPFANFTSNIPITACGAPLPINLINNSTGSAPLSYQWTIGANTYTSPTVVDTIWQPGGYGAQLIVTNSIGCKDTLSFSNYFWVGSIQAAMNLPDTACLNSTIDFFNTSNGGTSFSWSFGDGTFGFGTNVSHSYSMSGNYTVSLVASTGSSCADTVTQIINIENVQALFSSTPNFACMAPLTVNFTDQSIGNIVSWDWHFGVSPGMGQDTSDLQNPTNDYLLPGIYDDTLTVTTAAGCSSTLIKPANEEIFITQAEFIPDSIQGCAPLTVNFNNTTTPFDSVDYVTWNYMDGTPLDTNYSPTHVFNSAGVFNVLLTVYSVSGCVTMYSVTISVGAVQTANFTIDTNISCASSMIGFTNLSFDTSLITSYLWDFGDSITSSDFEPTHLFTDTGYMAVSLIVYYNGCPDTLVIDSAIQILGPLITYSPTLDCDTPNHYFFNPSTRGGTSFLWTFGDGSPQDSVNIGVDHYYPPNDGNYTTTFWAYDSITGCSYSKNALIKVRYLVGSLTVSDTNACKGQTVYVNTFNSVNATANVDWSLNDSTNYSNALNSTGFVMNTLGDNYVYAIVYDINSCPDTLSQLIRVWQPTANFGGVPTTGCAPLAVQFIDSSTSDTNIIAWNWVFQGGGNSNLQNPSYTFNGSGDTYFDVTLTVTDTFGCKNKVKFNNYIFVREPPSYFAVTNRLMCDNDTAYFHSAPTGNYTYLWDFGDGTTSTLFQDQHPYPTGVYTPSLKITDSFGCDSTFVRNNYIKVQDFPIANFVANPLSTFCYPSSITFTDSSIAQNVASWTWNFGDSPNWVSSSVNPAQNLYTYPGIYDVTMVITTTYGCSDTITKPNFIDIGGPTADIVINPTIGCVGETIDFDADNTNVDAEIFMWDFGDGFLDTTDAIFTALVHTYPNPGTYSVVLLYQDSLGLCMKTDVVDLVILEVIANFKPNKFEGCSPLNVAMLNQSTGSDKQSWYLDNAWRSQNLNAAFSIVTPGIHNIQLIAWDDSSTCADTVIKTVEVFANPKVKVTEDKVVCLGNSLKLLATGAETYKWSPATYLNYVNVPNPTSTPLTSIQYVVQGYDSNNCKNEDTVNVTVQMAPELTYFPKDTSIFTGGEFQVNSAANMPIFYNWSPAEFLSCNDCKDPIAYPPSPTQFVLTYGDLNGCFTFDSAFFVNVEDEYSVYIPNAFTPNWDGKNDLFRPIFYGFKDLVFMRIFDRWGKMVFETTDLNAGWDGRIDGTIVAHNSIFTYTIQLERFNGEVLDFTGFVTLISH